MPQTAIPTAAGETAGSGRAPHYLLAYLEEGRVRVYASGKPAYGSDGSFPERTKCASKRNCSGSTERDKGQASSKYACPRPGCSAACACSA